MPNDKGRIPIGFWRPTLATAYTTPDELALPDPHTLIDPAWDAAERAQVAARLDAGQVLTRYRGSSKCRICGAYNGSQDLGDEQYRWPSGLGHYVREHAVRLPDEVLEHFRNTR